MAEPRIKCTPNSSDRGSPGLTVRAETQEWLHGGYIAIFGGEAYQQNATDFVARDHWLLAERVGFEPTVRENRTPDFESGAFDHSATSPGSFSRGAKPEILTEVRA